MPCISLQNVTWRRKKTPCRLVILEIHRAVQKCVDVYEIVQKCIGWVVQKNHSFYGDLTYACRPVNTFGLSQLCIKLSASKPGSLLSVGRQQADRSCVNYFLFSGGSGLSRQFKHTVIEIHLLCFWPYLTIWFYPCHRLITVDNKIDF